KMSCSLADTFKINWMANCPIVMKLALVCQFLSAIACVLEPASTHPSRSESSRQIYQGFSRKIAFRFAAGGQVLGDL
ncbi:MAG: hypothetical protein ABI977_03545, partial [Acidobacteriota bacterium]